MDFIKCCFEEKKATLTNSLKQAGLPDDITVKFLSETSTAIINVIEKSNLEKTIEILLSDNPAQLLQSINVQAMANKLEINTELVSTGLEAISPEVSKVFNANINEIVAATASLAWKTNDKSFDLAENY